MRMRPEENAIPEDMHANGEHRTDRDRERCHRSDSRMERGGRDRRDGMGGE